MHKRASGVRPLVIRPGVEAYGFDGSRLGVVLRFCRTSGTVEVDTGKEILSIPVGCVGLNSPSFVVLRGTSRDLLERTGTRRTPPIKATFGRRPSKSVREAGPDSRPHSAA